LGSALPAGTLNVGQSSASIQRAALETRPGYRVCERGRGGLRRTARRAVHRQFIGIYQRDEKQRMRSGQLTWTTSAITEALLNRL
jgi:hypothetical protein